MHESEFKVVAISDVSGGYFRQDGINIPEALSYAIKNGSLKGYENADSISNEQLLELDVDMLVPAALGGCIHRLNAGNIKAKYIIEGANGPVTAGADPILEEQGTIVLPDILANAGGVTVSYFEWVQNRQYYSWDLNRVRQQLDSVLSHAFEDVWQESNENKVSLRTAAFMIAIRRVVRATERAGI
jgi:glutamate dehydrogenase (NAD(P)+)